MKAYLCSIGEPTTEIVSDLLEEFGFDVILLGELEPWYDKYKRFIFQATEDCIRIDADVIPNKNIREMKLFDSVMCQTYCYDMYKNDIGISSPIFYSKDVLEKIRKDFHLVGTGRPETDASRIPSVNPLLFTSKPIMGIHGIYQRREDVERHYKHKVERKQIDQYNFNLINNLQNLCDKKD